MCSSIDGLTDRSGHYFLPPTDQILPLELSA
ncbi:Uncharacterised protein [Mycolicibacterium gilvum]|uniref:Uncharacterized protein n=1 Tax=Mycolicibacterium gilvum TaxID=1804 RepID=A0A378SHU1_9MYCO|nr:Uncharacterised protein [Mycolicibacterium gilvum]